MKGCKSSLRKLISTCLIPSLASVFFTHFYLLQEIGLDADRLVLPRQHEPYIHLYSRINL